MRSLQLKFSALLVALLVLACLGVGWMATFQERDALEEEARKRGGQLARILANSVNYDLVLGENLLVEEDVFSYKAPGVEAVRVIRVMDSEVKVVASLAIDELNRTRPTYTGAEHEKDEVVERMLESRRLLLASPVVVRSKVPESDREVVRHLGEAQIEMDLVTNVDEVVAHHRKALIFFSACAAAAGVMIGLWFVARLVKPLRALRKGVEELASGNLGYRVAPSSRDEVGELTRAFNEMSQALENWDRIKEQVGAYASDYVLKQMLENPGEELAGSDREATILFADIREFTRISEPMETGDVEALLNDVFQIASDCILPRAGTIDKFIGDSVMAYFGMPETNPRHVSAAVRAAIEIQRVIGERNRRLPPGGQEIGIGIGIHTGPVRIVPIGSKERKNYTAIGDAVNVAARLEKLAGAGEILVSEAVQRRVRGEFQLRFEGERQLSGRREAVHVYSVETVDGLQARRERTAGAAG